MQQLSAGGVSRGLDRSGEVEVQVLLGEVHDCQTAHAIPHLGCVSGAGSGKMVPNQALREALSSTEAQRVTMWLRNSNQAMSNEVNLEMYTSTGEHTIDYGIFCLYKATENHIAWLPLLAFSEQYTQQWRNTGTVQTMP
jgi:hypothetical protein